jgi:hypothetical protein
VNGRMNPAEMVLLPARGDEVCNCCKAAIVGEYTHLTETDGFDVIVCTGCFVDALLAWVAS